MLANPVSNPSLEAGKDHPPAIGLSLNKSLFKALHREARTLGISTAALIREIIKERMRDPRPLAIDPVYRSDGLKRRPERSASAAPGVSSRSDGVRRGSASLAIAALIGLVLCGLTAPGLSSPALAAAFDNDAANFDQSSPPVETHQVWVFRCTANRTGVPYLVGSDVRDGTLQVKGSRTLTYYGHINQVSPRVFEAHASRPDPYGPIILHAAGRSSWVRTRFGTDMCETIGGYDTPPAGDF